MYSKEFRRPTPPKNYSGTAFRGGSPYIAPSPDVPPPTPPLSPALLPPSVPDLPPDDEDLGAPTAAAAPEPEMPDTEDPATPVASEVPDSRDGGRTAAVRGGDCPGCRREPPPRPPEHGLLGALIPPGLAGGSGSGLGFEELLLTGLILLLAQSDRDSDLVLMLALLLLYQ